jgi:copper chaperone CopZ
VKAVRSALAKVDGVTVKEVAMPDKATVAVDRTKVTDEQLVAAVKSAGSRYSATVK